MDEELRKKYTAFVTAYIGNEKICLGGMILRHYNEDFFNQAVKDGILKEIDRSEDGRRQFEFTDLAREFV